EPAARALAHVAGYAAWKRQPADSLIEPVDIRRKEAAGLLSDVLVAGGGWLAPQDVRRGLTLYGVPTIEQRTVGTPDEAGDAAREIGGDIALKVIAPGVIHKADVGGVRLHLRGAAAVKRAAAAMAESVKQTTGVEPTGFVVQRMAAPGV